MKRAVKRNTLLALLICMLVSFGALCAAFGLNAKNAVFADTTSRYTKPETFEMFDGAQIRKTEGTSGIRFITVVSNDYINELINAHGADNVKFGAVVLPEDMLGENELTVEVEHADKMPSGGFAEENAEAGYSVYNSAIINIPESMYDRTLVARGYVAITGEDGTVTYTYTSNAVKRSVGLVASRALYEGNDTSSVVEGFVNAVAKNVTLGGKTEDTLKVTLTQIENAEAEEALSYAIATDPAGYAFKATSTNEQVVKIENGVVTPVAKTGTATVTVEFGTHTATLNLTVADYKIIVDGSEVSEGNEYNVFSADEYIGVVKDETKTHTYTVQEDIGEGFKPVSATITGNEAGIADLTEDGVIKGGNALGKVNLTLFVGDINVGSITVNGCAKITEIAHMDKLALVTWDYKNDVETAKKYLAATYVLGNDLDYAGQRILPIANVAPKVSSPDKKTWWVDNQQYDPQKYEGGYSTNIGDLADLISFNTFVWRDILTAYANGTAENWRTVKAAKIADGTWDAAKTAWENANNYNKAGVANFKGTNPENLPFTGIFNGNGYSIKHAAIIYANFFMQARGDRTIYYNAGGCVFGENQGTITNIDFYDLTYGQLYTAEDGVTTVGKVTAGEEGYQVYNQSGSGQATWQNSFTRSQLGGFLRYNADDAVLSNIKITFAAREDCHWSYWNDAKMGSLASGFGITYNRGLMKNVVMVLVSRGEDIGTLLPTGETSGFKGGANTLYVTNRETGVIEDCVFLSEVQESGNHKAAGIIHYGEDNVDTYNQSLGEVKNLCMAGTINSCTRKINDGTTSATAQYIADSNYDKTTFAAAWDITETAMTLKRGSLFN